MRYIGWLDDASQDLRWFGGKGASLATLHRAGFRVPLGFCVQAEAYRRFIAVNQLTPVIDQLLSIPDLRFPKVARQACAPLTAAMHEAALPLDVVEALVDGYATLRSRCGEEVVVAARSSALSEDAAAASSAGLYETYLNLRDVEAVLDGVLRCYRSLWTPRAVQYRAFKRLDSTPEAMAVVVMAMIDADVSGVAFTLNPLTGNHDQITVNASWGLGESIVSGRVTPDQFLLDKAGLKVVQQEIAPKDVRTAANPSGASGTVELAVPAYRAAQPALTQAELSELGALCLAIETAYQRPVDVEWAFHQGKLYVLQARPVTGID